MLKSYKNGKNEINKKKRGICPRGIKIAIGTSAIVPILALYSGNSGADSGKLKF